MRFLQLLYNVLFGKKKKQEQLGKDQCIEQPEVKVACNKNEANLELNTSSAVNESLESNPQVCNDVQDKPKKLSQPQEKKKRVRNVVGQKTLSEIKNYLLTHGSIDTVVCKTVFGVKSLQNFIWQLRKDGLEIKTKKHTYTDDSGQEKQQVFYILISPKHNESH